MMDPTERCDLCGDRGTPDDPVVGYSTGEPGGNEGDQRAHIECAQDAGWED